VNIQILWTSILVYWGNVGLRQFSSSTLGVQRPPRRVFELAAPVGHHKIITSGVARVLRALVQRRVMGPLEKKQNAVKKFICFFAATCRTGRTVANWDIIMEIP